LVINESPKIVISGGPKHLQQHHHHHHHHKHRTPPNNQPQVALTVSGSSVGSHVLSYGWISHIFANIPGAPWGTGGPCFLDKITRGYNFCVLLRFY
jgi:hypothetical protein